MLLTFSFSALYSKISPSYWPSEFLMSVTLAFMYHQSNGRVFIDLNSLNIQTMITASFWTVTSLSQHQLRHTRNFNIECVILLSYIILLLSDNIIFPVTLFFFFFKQKTAYEITV